MIFAFYLGGAARHRATDDPPGGAQNRGNETLGPPCVVFFCVCFLASFSAPFWEIWGSVLRPKTAPKSIKIAPETRSGSRRRSETVFHGFLSVFGGLRTSKIELPPTRELDFRKITVLAPGPPFEANLIDLTTVLVPQSHQKRLRKRLETTCGF